MLKTHVTVCALEWLITTVNPDMSLKITFFPKNLVTIFTLVPSFSILLNHIGYLITMYLAVGLMTTYRASLVRRHNIFIKTVLAL